MGGNNSTPQAPNSTISNSPDPNSALGSNQSYMSPLVMPQSIMAQQAASMPTGSDPISQARIQGQAIAAQMQEMQKSGAFDTPYQKAMKAHPVGMGIANAMQAFGQGITKQPFYTANQDNQASLQNTQLSGMNSMAALPAQIRTMMAMQGMYGNNSQGNSNASAPGTTQSPSTAIPSLQPPQLQAIRQAAPKGATHFSPTVGYTDDQGNPVK